MGRRGRRTKEMVATARNRIDMLFHRAAICSGHGDFHHSQRYVNLALRLGMRYNVRIPKEHHGSFCRNCHAFLYSSRTSRVRSTGGKITTTCLKCGSTKRHPYLRERKESRRRDPHA